MFLRATGDRAPGLFGAIFLLWGLLAGPAYASSILRLDIDQLLAKSELVFIGEVIHSESRWNETQTSINTHVEFLIEDIVQGEHPRSNLELIFSGGKVGTTALKIEGMRYPNSGERGVYFVLSTSERYINPLAGWSQGHFRILRDQAGEDRILTENGDRVTGLVSRRSRSAGVVRGPLHRKLLSTGTAEMVLSAPADQSMETAITKAAFIDALRRR